MTLPASISQAASWLASGGSAHNEPICQPAGAHWDRLCGLHCPISNSNEFGTPATNVSNDRGTCQVSRHRNAPECQRGLLLPVNGTHFDPGGFSHSLEKARAVRRGPGCLGRDGNDPCRPQFPRPGREADQGFDCDLYPFLVEMTGSVQILSQTDNFRRPVKLLNSAKVIGATHGHFYRVRANVDCGNNLFRAV